ncbi:MAG: DUF1700 domain-containing protein [Methanobacterium sp.]|uniref:HAAS signaling domain-containing protein n=1 Tax=Methanobacterium sp. TaxID=2164 RepID=UPI003D659F9B|nr:DUF1700 domain-containing protein [Methanobacterium sp.]
MNKDEYLEKLTKLVKEMPKEDREDILSDYEEHFRIGLEKGRSEEELSKALGDPKTVVKQIKVEHIINKAENKPSAGLMLEAVLAAAGLGIFNLIFVVGPVLVLVAIIIGLFVTGIAVIFSGILTMLSPLLQVLFPQYFHSTVNGGFFNNLIIMAGGILLTMAGIVIVVFMAFVAKWLYKLMIKYLKLNLRIIKGQKNVSNDNR